MVGYSAIRNAGAGRGGRCDHRDHDLGPQGGVVFAYTSNPRIPEEARCVTARSRISQAWDRSRSKPTLQQFFCQFSTGCIQIHRPGPGAVPAAPVAAPNGGAKQRWAATALLNDTQLLANESMNRHPRSVSISSSARTVSIFFVPGSSREISRRWSGVPWLSVFSSTVAACAAANQRVPPGPSAGQSGWTPTAVGGILDGHRPPESPGERAGPASPVAGLSEGVRE